MRWLALLAASLAAGGAASRALPPPTGELRLDIADPVVTVTIAGVPLRLRVDLGQHDVVELNRAAVARLPLPFSPGPTDAVGRVDVPSVVADASFTMNGRPVAVTLASHGDCCAGVDGAIGPAALPYALVRFVREGGTGGEARTFAMSMDASYGLHTREALGRETLRLGFSLTRGETLATAAAGAILAQAQGGRFEGGYAPVSIAFGIERPARVIVLLRSVTLAGFRFDRIRTRTADYGGRRALPREAVEGGEIVVSRRMPAQREWPAITIGRDRLDRCAEIAFQPAARLLTLRCDFE
jgi:hypothetical protein